MINDPEMGFSQDPQLRDQKVFAVYATSFCSAVHCCSFRLFNVNLKSGLLQNSYFSWYEFSYF